MNLDDLRTGLADLAEEARPADLRDRAVRTSHRLARIRLALGAAVTVAVVGVTSAGFALSGHDRALPEIATPPAPPGGATTAVYIDNLPGFGNMAVWDGGGVRILDFRDHPVGRYGGDELRDSLAVSPDGTYLSWVSHAGLHLSRLGGNDMVVLNRQDGDFLISGVCAAPAWASDSTRLLTAMWQPEANRVETGWFAVDGGVFTPRDDEQLRHACDVHINGDWAVYTVSPRLGTFDTYVRNLRTGESRTIPDRSGNRLDFEISSVSPDGDRITARLIDNDAERHAAPPRTLEAHHVIDTRTGESLPLGVATGGLGPHQLFFTPAGDLVARYAEADRSWLELLTPDGRLISRADEPAEVRESVLLRLVVP